MAKPEIFNAMYAVVENMTTANGYAFNWSAVGGRDYREMAMSNEPLMYISFMDEDGEENLDNKESGGGAQNTEFYDMFTAYVYYRVPLDFPNDTPESRPMYSGSVPKDSEYIAYVGEGDVKKAFDCLSPNGNILVYNDPDTKLSPTGLREIDYVRGIKVTKEQENKYNTIELRSSFEIKYRSPRLR